jgi:hypothetical protein
MSVENTMHDKCKNVIIFHNNLCKFFKSLKGVLPEYVDTIRECIAYYKSCARSSYLKECEGLITPHISYISQYDYGILTDDYARGPRYLLPKMDFREIWNILDSEDFQEDTVFLEKTKKSIFNHIQTIYVSIQMAMTQIGIFDRNMEKQKVFLMNMLENLQMDDKIKERIEQMKLEEAEAAAKGQSGNMLNGIAELLGGEDNFIYQLAKEVADELDMGNDDINDPVSAITGLFADGGRKIRELIVTVGDRIEQKVESGEIKKQIRLSPNLKGLWARFLG